MKKLCKLFVTSIIFILFVNINVFTVPPTADQKIQSITQLSSTYPDHVVLIKSIVNTYIEQLSNLDQDIKNFFPKDCTYVAPEILFLSNEQVIYIIKYRYLERSLMINLPPDKVNTDDKCHLHILGIFYNKSLSQIRQEFISIKKTIPCNLKT